MEYKIKVNDELTNVYEVSFDIKKLKEIYKLLENYKYDNFSEINGGSVYKIPLLKRNQQKLMDRRRNDGSVPLYDTFKVNNDGYGYSYLITWKDFPELYKYLDIILNDKKPSYYGLFGYVTGNLNYIYADIHRESLALQAIFDYLNNEDLKKLEDRERKKTLVKEHENILNELIQNSLKDYDVLGLTKLYVEVLKCINLKLKYRIIKTNDLVNINGKELVLKKEKKEELIK